MATIIGHSHKDLVEVTVDVDGDAGDAVSTLIATAEHPFWVDDHGRLLQPAVHGLWGEAPGWYHAEDLDPGDQLRTPTGDKVRVVDIRAYTTTTTVHNLTINGVHTYHVVVGGRAVLTHNDNCPRAFVKYEDITKGKSIPNRLTDVDHNEVDKNLIESGWSRQPSKDGKVYIYTKDGDKYILREHANSHEGWNLDRFASGKKTVKIRLGGEN